MAKDGTAAQRTTVGYLYVTGATLLWSAVPVCVKFSLASIDSYTICWLRFAVGAAILFVFGRLRGISKPLGRSHLPLVILAAVGIGGNYACYIRAFQDTTASAGNVVVQFEVVSVVILSHFWLKERIPPAKLGGMLVTFAGVLLALWNGESLRDLVRSEYFLGNMLILLAAPLWAVYGISQKLLTDRGVCVSTSLAHIFAAAAVLTLPVMLVGHERRGPVTAEVGVSLFVLVVLSTVGSYLLMGRGFRHLEASTAAMVTCLLPIFTIAAARVFLSAPSRKFDDVCFWSSGKRRRERRG